MPLIEAWSPGDDEKGSGTARQRPPQPTSGREPGETPISLYHLNLDVMGRLIDGEWHTAADMVDREDDGTFDREETTFRDAVRDDPEARFQPARDRYHLYVSYACPWAHRALLTRALLGLEDVISVDVVDPHRIDQGWEFAPEKDGCTPDSIHGAEYLRDVYTAADPTYTGRVTVPVLWDTQEATIVNNESEEIIKMFATAFESFATRDVDLYPRDRQAEIDEVIDDIYPSINNGVYRAGFAGSQSAYDRAVEELFDALASYDEHLAESRYLLGTDLTLADVCMFTTLYRFDEVYHTHFKCNRRQITDYDNLWGYLRELYQLPGVVETCRMDHVKEHYYRSHEDLNPAGLIPVGPEPPFEAPHERDRLAGGPPSTLTGQEQTAGD
jgi:putative glutathione S-transferase